MPFLSLRVGGTKLPRDEWVGSRFLDSLKSVDWIGGDAREKARSERGQGQESSRGIQVGMSFSDREKNARYRLMDIESRPRGDLVKKACGLVARLRT